MGAFIAPLSAVVFNIADVESERVMDAVKKAGLHVSKDGKESNRFCPLEAFLEKLREEQPEAEVDSTSEGGLQLRRLDPDEEADSSYEGVDASSGSGEEEDPRESSRTD